MGYESQDADDKMWPPYIEQIFIEIMLDEQLKENMENGVFKKVIQKHNRLRQKQQKWG